MDIRKLRGERSLREFGHELGCSAATVLRMERGQYPRGELLLRIQAWAKARGKTLTFRGRGR
jgi:hypothetical protein